MKRERFVLEVAKKLRQVQCDLFIGAGISAPSGLPTWSDFLRPFLNDLGIEITEGDDLPLLAQYVVNRNAGNRNIITEAIYDTFGKEYSINGYHSIISKFPVKTVWTTNYDNLLEKAFSEREPRIILSEETLLHPSRPTKMEIIKLHGDANSAAKGIVLTRDDYNHFIYDKKMISQRLREAIINRSLLFLGYSYNDSDIQNIMTQALLMKEKISNNHYILLCDISKKDGENDTEYIQRKIRFKFWISELNRVGLNELVVSQEEIIKVLSEIEQAARDSAVYVTGSHDATKEEKDIAYEAGVALAECKKVVLNCGQSIGIGNAVMSGFINTVFEKKQEITKRIKFFHNPYAITASYADDPSLIPILKAERNPLISSSTYVIAFRGSSGTEAEIDIALAKERIVIPFITSKNDYSNDVIIKILSDSSNMSQLKKIMPNYYKILEDKIVPNSETIFCAIKEAVNE